MNNVLNEMILRKQINFKYDFDNFTFDTKLFKNT